MFSFVFLLPFPVLNFITLGHLYPTDLLCCLGINPPLLFIPHLSHNPLFVTSQLATCGDDYNVMNKGLWLGVGNKIAGHSLLGEEVPVSK
jgi:hypothetical protein